MQTAEIIPIETARCLVSIREKAEHLVEAAKRSGNQSLETSARFRIALTTMDAEHIQENLSKGRGIGAEVSVQNGVVKIVVGDPFSVNWLIHALGSEFNVIAGTAAGSRKFAVLVQPQLRLE